MQGFRQSHGPVQQHSWQQLQSWARLGRLLFGLAQHRLSALLTQYSLQLAAQSLALAMHALTLPCWSSQESALPDCSRRIVLPRPPHCQPL